MFELVWNAKKECTDLNVCQFGIENCEPLHAYGPAVRDHFLIHCVLDGKGVFHSGNEHYQIKKGQGFLIYPDTVTFYQADEQEPWSYAWIGLQGVKAEYYLKSAGLSGDSPVFNFHNAERINGIITKMLSVSIIDTHGELVTLSCLYDFLALLTQTGITGTNQKARQNRSELYIRKTIEYMEKNYSRHLEIEDIAQAIGLDRNYLGVIFKKGVNMTMKEFLTAFRVNRACELLEDSKLTIGDVSRSVGYDDPLLFSKVFKKIKNVSPSMFRDSIPF